MLERACSPPRFDFLEAFKRAAYNKFPDRINREPGEFVAGNIIVRGRLEFFSKECMQRKGYVYIKLRSLSKSGGNIKRRIGERVRCKGATGLHTFFSNAFLTY